MQARKQSLAQDRLELLLQIPAVADRMQGTWQTRYAALLEWVSCHRSLPSRAAKADEEKSLAIWLTDQCMQARKQSLAQDRLELLLQIPIVADRLQVQVRRRSWEVRYAALLEWVSCHGSWPSQSAKTDEEKSLAIWLKDQCTQARKQSLAQDRLELLLQIEVRLELAQLSKDSANTTDQQIQSAYSEAIEDFRSSDSQSFDHHNGSSMVAEDTGSPCVKFDTQQLSEEIPTTNRFEAKFKELLHWQALHNNTMPEESSSNSQERLLAKGFRLTHTLGKHMNFPEPLRQSFLQRQS